MNPNSQTEEPRDIDLIIRGVREAIPSVRVVQLDRIYAADDDGLWWFRLPGVSRDIQLESPTYCCPFTVEHDDMASSTEALIAQSVPEAIDAVVSYLRSISTRG